MSWEPDAATLAIFGTAASLLGILITNQSKVSEFRQKWIDALRDDASMLITHTLVIHAAKVGDSVDESFSQIYQTTARIRLRLNPDEPQTIAVITAMNHMRDANHTEVPTEFTELNLRIGAFTEKVQIVLKREWRRVKFGEPLYRWTFAAIAVAMLVTLGIVLKNTFSWHLNFIPCIK